MDLISVIVPVYNVIAYLSECLDSILQQTYRNLDIILVDDGSTDGCGQLCDQYAERDSRIRVLRTENRGLGAARNAGLDIAAGDYIVFADSDDLLLPDSIAILRKQAQLYHAAVSVAGAYGFALHKDIPDVTEQESVCISSKEAVKRMLRNDGFGHEAWGKLYAKSVWEKKRFPEGVLYEDYEVLFQIIAEADKIAVYPAPLYLYRVRTGSIMNASLSEKNFVLIRQTDAVTQYVTDIYPDLRDEALAAQTVVYMKLLKGILDANASAFSEVQTELIKKIKKNKSAMLSLKTFKRVDRIKIRTLLIHKRLFYFAYRVGDRLNARKL